MERNIALLPSPGDFLRLYLTVLFVLADQSIMNQLI